jgi:glucose-6-phosphate isomerase
MPKAEWKTLAERLIAERAVSRMWERDATLWTSTAGADDGVRAAIRNRLGWLDAPHAMRAHVDRLRALAKTVRDERVAAVYLVGMGGSSLCAEVLKAVYRVAPGFPELFVLDTTDDETLASISGRLDPSRTWFLISSKSGSTIEVAAMERYFWDALQRPIGPRAGRHFLAITDPGTPLERLARERGYRDIFLNPPDIGGRFSALSLFGLVPAALIGVAIDDLLAAGGAMADGCRAERSTNPGLELGAFMGAAASEGRDKLVLLLPSGIAALGLWIEQLVAESTGKLGRGLLPVVDDEPPTGADRVFVTLDTDDDRIDSSRVRAIERAGDPLMRLSMRRDGLGAELFRWEFATAIAGAVLAVNPFDEPNVAGAKDRTRALLDGFARDGRLPEGPPVASDGHVAAHSQRWREATPPAVVAQAIESVKAGDYFAVLSYLPPDSPTETVIDELRAAVRSRTGVVTTVGVGPRYLHSTGQYHKGGPDRGAFLILTAEDRTTTPVPGAPYSFAVLKRAQAIGDYQALAARGRRVVRIHLTRAGEDRARVLEELFSRALGAGR